MNLREVLFGRPLRSSDAGREQITALQGLPALSLDALTSVAYGPQAIVIVLAAAGASALPLVEPITWSIVALLVLLILSYRQVIDAYPHGGGAYAVSKDNFGAFASQLAAASLIVDYVLTVAVSIAAGVAALTSAFPSLIPDTLAMSLGMLAIITFANLRGVGESARLFMLPTALFVLGLLAIIGIGIVHPLGGPVPAPPPSHTVQVVGVLLILKAFSSGCSALTGVEAIANGVPLFREPRVIRAKRTELLLGILLGVMLLGLSFLDVRFHVGPRPTSTVLSDIMVAAVGKSWLYYVVDLSITVALALAANTSFGGLPILFSLLARDHSFPHLFAVRGDRLVFRYGVIVLAVLSAALLVAAGANTNAMIPLYAIGVFTGFTLAQAGLVVHWRRTKPPRWWARASLNGVGAVTTAVATLIFLFTKFTAGAWVVVVAIPLFILLFRRIRSYYAMVGRVLEIGRIPAPLERQPTLVIVPVTSLSRLTQHAISEATSFGTEVLAVTVQFADEDPSDLQAAWQQWNPGVELQTVRSEYHSLARPITRFVTHHEQRFQGQVVVLIPEVLPRRWRHRLLHNHMELLLTAALRRNTGALIARVVFRLHD